MLVNSRPASGYGRAFLFYLGNEENTHTKTPQTFTDDYVAAEIVESGRSDRLITSISFLKLFLSSSTTISSH